MTKRWFSAADRDQRIITLRLKKRLEFRAIADMVGCTARWAQHVCALAGIPFQRHGKDWRPSPRALPHVPMPTFVAAGPSFTHRWRLSTMLPSRRGHACKIVNPTAWHLGQQAQIMVEFADGLRVMAPRNAIRKVDAIPRWRASVEFGKTRERRDRPRRPR